MCVSPNLTVIVYYTLERGESKTDLKKSFDKLGQASDSCCKNGLKLKQLLRYALLSWQVRKNPSPEEMGEN